jgi:predicted O-methyltransferase YrrM
MSMGGTASYETTDVVVPPLVRAAVSAATELDFPLCCRPEIGRLISVLAAGVPAGGRIGETGTGTGAGLAWMVSTARPDVKFVSIELDVDRTDAARQLFADRPSVTVITGDSATIGDHGPFDLLVLDGALAAGRGRIHPPIRSKCSDRAERSRLTTSPR